MKWSNEHGRMPKTWNKGEHSLYQKWCKSEEKKIVDKYVGKSLEEIPDEHRELVGQIRALGYGIGTGLSPFEEVMKWANKQKRIPKVRGNDREEINLYQKWRKSEEKKIADKYAGKELGEIPEEHRALVEQVRALGYEGKSSKKIKTQDIAKNTYDALAPKCNEAAGVIEGLVQEKSEQDQQLKK